MPLTASDILAGPIVRRVEPARVCVWLALSRPASLIELQVFRGHGRRDELSAPLAAAAPTPEQSSRRFENRTIPIGRKLHVGLAVFEPAVPGDLEWGREYAYDVRITVEGEGTAVGLDDLGLLEDGTIRALDGTEHPHLSLGYGAHVLPSFVLPPVDVKELRVAHGSCRRHCVDQRDALAALDDLLQEASLVPTQRIHQLLLTGDQIYADAVAGEQLLFTSEMAARLLDADDGKTVERIPIDLTVAGAAKVVDVPVDMTHLPASRRTHVINSLGGGTSTDAEHHVLGFGEAAALYLTAWCSVGWPDLRARVGARWALVEKYGQAYRTLVADLRKRLALPQELESKTWKQHAGELRTRVGYFHAALLLRPELQRIDGVLSDAERLAEWLPADDPPLDAEASGYAWKTFWGEPRNGKPADPQRAMPANGGVGATEIGSALALPELQALARALTPSWYAGRHYWNCTISLDTLHDTQAQHDPIVSDAGHADLSKMQWFLDDLPKVRRVLANVSTLMVFDDHEITDDWNLHLRWARRTYGSAVGRAMVRNLLAAYALFQHWGNDPVACREPGTPGHKTLLALQRMFFDADGAPLAAGAPAAIRDELDRLFDLLGPDKPATPPGERIHWHFTYQGPHYELLVLDSRTWREYLIEGEGTIGQPTSDQASTYLISAPSVPMQIPEVPPPGTEVSLVITPAPFIGMPVAEGIVQPTLNAADSVPHTPEAPFVGRKQATNVGRAAKDPEPFGFAPRLFEEMLARLANRRRVVLFSGDVHYSLALEMSYWRLAGEPLGARFVQLISSSLRNPRGQSNMEIFTMDLAQQLAQLVTAQSRLGWKRRGAGTPQVLLDGDAGVNSRIRRALKEDPILLPVEALPPGTRVAPPEWAWRMALVPDARPETQRLVALEPPSVSFDVATNPAQAFVELARRHRWSSEHVMPRRWMWWTNVGVVEFAANGADGLKVRQRLFVWDVDGGPRPSRDRLTIECSLDLGSEAPPAVA